ncbi:RpiB/LacA/LacB family sugar-phosphate isomerase [Solitalea koreensis]|uniref:Ribose 5-phosphate isomerase B n=1 Tax=Solitalea koreensis TaxID=543615 RepID=A0A521E235_9SPHI|nr:RpiB/LacA/LacB family sugar-phosphate isomerase [Solitalea koreensis]SMO77895.1 ribose 5-phosphate isomerase B [Solitalea koreensis]
MIKTDSKSSYNQKQIGVASDHAGFELKQYLKKILLDTGYEVRDFGNIQMQPNDDYPDYIIPLARAIAEGSVTRGIAICGSGVGACVAANKIAGVRACLIHEKFSAHQGVEDDDMNMICLGGRVIDQSLAWELTSIFLSAKFSKEKRHIRRLKKITALENGQK